MDRGAIHDNEDIPIQNTWYTGSTPAIRARLKPQQVITFDAGNLGLAVTQERADAFEHVTNRRFVAPSGNYTLQATERFGTSFTLKDGDGNVLAPVDGDFRGNLTTGAATIDISNEIVEGEIVDAVTGKPVEGTTVYFVIVKPKTATSDELPVGNLFWGPKSPSKIYFTIMPEDIAQRPIRDELEIRWGIGNHPDYEDYAPTERIPLKEFFHEGPRTAREVLSQIKLIPKKKVDAKAGTSSLNIKYDMPGAEAETRVHVERIARLPSTDWRREEYGNEEYGTVRFSRLKNGQSLTLENLPAGRFQVSRYRLVDMVREGEGKALQHARLDMQIIELTSGETRTVDLSRPAGHSISGSVKVPAEWQVNTLVVHVCNDRVGGSGTLNHPDVRQFDLLNADATGKFKTEPLLPGRYKLVVEGYANHALNVSGIIAPSWEGTAEVTISESQEPSPIEVSLHELNRERWLEDQTAAERDSRRAQVIERFQGTWAMDICDSEVAGFGDSQDIVKNWRWAVNGNEIKWTRSNGEIWKLTFTVDPTKSPNEIDLTFLDGPHKGEKCLGMYERRGVGGKLLWFCLTDPGSQAPRPTKVSHSYKEGRTMIGLSLMADAPFEKKAEQADADRSELAVLVESFATARYTWEQHDIVREIIELGDTEAISQMEKFLNSENRGTRCNAGLVLARLGDKRGLDCIIQELQDTKARPTTEEVNEGKNNGPNQL
ncbi:MAG: TIGR03067 domain-containing protein, partial [Planctomycetales bacterium]|nr:TIGR03067 domain-containing protein [Planctomycetales bacterium]